MAESTVLRFLLWKYFLYPIWWKRPAILIWRRWKLLFIDISSFRSDNFFSTVHLKMTVWKQIKPVYKKIFFAEAIRTFVFNRSGYKKFCDRYPR